MSKLLQFFAVTTAIIALEAPAAEPLLLKLSSGGTSFELRVASCVTSSYPDVSWTTAKATVHATSEARETVFDDVVLTLDVEKMISQLAARLVPQTPNRYGGSEFAHQEGGGFPVVSGTAMWLSEVVPGQAGIRVEIALATTSTISTYRLEQLTEGQYDDLLGFFRQIKKSCAVILPGQIIPPEPGSEKHSPPESSQCPLPSH